MMWPLEPTTILPSLSDAGVGPSLDDGHARVRAPTTAPLIAGRRTMIGTMYSEGELEEFVFECGAPGCAGKTFGRWYDFKRHFNGAHATVRAVYWCPAHGCARGEAVGERPFPRKNKVNDHVEAMHGGWVS
jgi:hypothetical protein